MVRETRHLWVGNLPHAIREERILEHFKRYGKVQSVKILPKKDEEAVGGGGGSCATVAFIDIKSAAKAHNAENKIDERTLKTDYYEPPASSTASSAIFIHERDDALVGRSPVPPPPPAPYAAGRNARYGLPEDRNYDRPSHYYERVGDREPYLRRPLGMGYHDEDNFQGRAKSRDRYVRSASGNTYTEGTERSQNHFRARQHFEQTRYSEQYNDEREVAPATPRLNRRTNNGSTVSVVSSVASPTNPAPPPSRSESRSRRMKRRSPSRTPSGSRSNSMSRSRSRSSSGSRSSSSSSKLRSSSSDSSCKSRSPSKSRSPVTSYGSQSSSKGSRLDRPASAIANPSNNGSYLSSSVSSSAINCTSVNSQGSTSGQGSSTPTSNDISCDKDEKKPLGICVRNLPVRSTDTSLKDGLFHEYKKHGKVTMVKVIGQGTDRYAVVCFKKPEDVDKALEVSKDKLFFGCKIEVTAHEGLDADDNEFRPLEAELDEFHPKATRTLFIGNLEKDITTAELRKHFDQFGEIIEIDIKKQGSATSYAFIQYSDIASVVKAMRKLDGENLGANRIKLGFGKSMPTNCVWLDGIVDSINEKFLARHFSRFGPITYCAIDREKGHALVFYETVELAQIAVSEMRGRILGGKKLQVDFASRECQTTFFDKLEMTGQTVGDRPWERRERRTAEFDILRGDDRDPVAPFGNRVYTRYEGQTRTNRGNFRGVQRTAFSTRGRGQAFPARYEMYYDEFGERRHRYITREENSTESLPFDNKTERSKYSETTENTNRKRSKLRNSISDQESHHSQSPPRSRHESRSTSPVSKDRKSLKDRGHHRVKSPGSHNSSQVSSPCRESASEEPMELVNDYKDYRLKNSDSKNDLGEGDILFPMTPSPKGSLHDGLEKSYMKAESDSSRRRSSIDSDIMDENSSASEQLSQLERKRRLLASTSSSSLIKESSNPVASKSSDDRLKLKSALSHPPIDKIAQENCVSHVVCDEKNEVNDNELHDSVKEKQHSSGESANTDLKYLQKKQVHILHLLEQLHEGGVNSSDTDGSIDGDRYSRKKQRSLSCVENMCTAEKDIAKAITKDESFAKAIKSGIKEHPLAKGINKGESVDTNNCFSLSLDSYVFNKHLDPRKVDHQTTIVNSLQNCRRISSDKEELLLNSQKGGGDSFVSAPAELLWKKSSENCLPSRNSEELSPLVHSRVKEEPVDGDTSVGVNSFSVSTSSEVSKTLQTVRTFSSDPVSHDIKRERDVSPLSLPLPKFAATLKSPKSSPSVITSPRSIAHSPRRVHSPNSYSSTKGLNRLQESLQEVQQEKKKDNCFEDKVNGIASVLSSATSSPSESNLHSEILDITCLEPIQSPKSSSEKNRDSVAASPDSDLSPVSSPNSQSIEDRIKALDEIYKAWSGSTRTVCTTSIPETPPPTVIDLPKSCVKKRSRFNFLTQENRNEPSEIVKSLLSKSTIFDQDSMRLQHIDEKYEPLNVKMDLSLKGKPTFRTKAAAKEFSSPIASSLPTFSSTPLPKTQCALPSTGIASPPDTPCSAISNSVVSPVTPPTPFTPLSAQIFSPCSPRIASFQSRNSKDLDDIPLPKEVPGDQAGLTPKVLNTVKVKNEPVIGVVSPIEVMSHGLLGNSFPVKSEPLALKENLQPLSTLSEAAFAAVSDKKDVSVLKTNIPLEKDFAASLLKDPVLFKSVNSALDHSRKDMAERINIQSNCGKWKEVEKNHEMVDAKTVSSLECPDLKVATPASKKRLSSLDSESDSGKSCKSLESNCEPQEVISWPKHEKPESKSVEPECKKAKLSSSKTEKERSPTPMPGLVCPKKSERKEKSSKSERVKSSDSHSKSGAQSSFDKEENETKSSGKYETKEKSKSDSHKHREDRKSSKSRDQKESSIKHDHQKSSDSKSTESSSRSLSSSSSSTTKTKKDHSSSGSSKSEKMKTEKKSSSEKKQQNSSSKSSSKKYEDEIPIEGDQFFLSMYDKVKARSNKMQQNLRQTKDLETVRQKFSKLKQTRQKREEKSKSADHDSDKDSDYLSDHSSDSDTQQAKASKARQQRKRKLVIESSSDEEDALQTSQTRTMKTDKESAESASDSESEQKIHQKHVINRNRKKKLDIIESDSSDSASQLTVKPQAVTKKKSKSKPLSSKKVIKSDVEGSDVEMSSSSKPQSREKEHRRKKQKKPRSQDSKQERDATSDITFPSKKPSDDMKNKKKSSHKEDRSQISDVAHVTKHEESSREKGAKERKSSRDSEMMEVDIPDKLKSMSKKKKKSKKTSRSKEKRASSDRKRSSEFTSKNDEESESKSSLPVLSSPMSNSPSPDKPASPPCLQVGDVPQGPSSDHSHMDSESHTILDVHFPSNDWKPKSIVKSDVPSEKVSKSSKKKDNFSPLKHSTDFHGSDFEHDHSSSEKVTKSSSSKDHAGHSTASSETSSRTRTPSSSSKKSKDSSSETSHHKVKHEKSMDSGTPSKCDEDKTHGNHVKEEKRKKKLKKQSKEKEKKTKPKEEPPKESSIPTNLEAPVAHRPSSPILFESVSLDNDSRLSDIRLDEEIAEEARRLEEELMVASEETSTFGDDTPTTATNVKKEEKPAERKFEEEAAKETKRLEAELFSTSHESWHMEDKPFGPELLSESLEAKDGSESTSLPGKDENLFATLNLHTSSVVDSTQRESDIFLPDSSQYKLDDKDNANEIDDQRKIEDDLAVSALLQEMNNEIPAPELTKETDFLEPLISGQPEDTINYLLPGDGDNAIDSEDNSPDLLVDESDQQRLVSENMVMSPLSNSEPPALEISTFEDTSALKEFQDSKNVPAGVTSDVVTSPPANSVCDTFESRILKGSEKPMDVSLDEAQNKPPVIDIPVRNPLDNAMDNSIASSRAAKRSERSMERSPRLIKECVLQIVEGDDGALADNDNNPNEFEDITMDIADSKDDDNPPVLLPVDLPPRLSSVPEDIPKEASRVQGSESLFTVSKGQEGAQVEPRKVSKDSSNDAVSSSMPLKRIDSDPALSIDFEDDSCSELGPLTISEFYDSSKDAPENDSAETVEGKSYSHSVFSETPDAEVVLPVNNKQTQQEEKNIINSLLSDPEKAKAAEDVSISKETDFKELSVPEFSDIKVPEAEENQDTVIHDTTVIRSTNMTPVIEEHPSKYIADADECDRHVITTDSFLYNVFGTNKECRNMVIFSTSQLGKQNDEQNVCNDSVNKDSTETPKRDSGKEETVAVKSSESFVDSTSNLSTSSGKGLKEPLIQPEPLHFPPLFSIPSESLLTSTTDKPEEDGNASDANSEDAVDKPNTEPRKEEEFGTVTEKDSELDVCQQSFTDSVDEDVQYDEHHRDTLDEEQSVPMVSLAETLSKIDEKSNMNSCKDRKSESADVESVSSDTTDIAVPDIKGEFEMNQVTSGDEQAPENTYVPEEEVPKVIDKSKPKVLRRGRRPKPRRCSEAAAKSENQNETPAVNPMPTRSSKRARQAPSRRSLRSGKADPSPAFSEKEQEAEIKDTNPDAHSDIESRNYSSENKLSEQTSVIEPSETLMDSGNSAEGNPETKQPEKVYNTRSGESKRRKGGRKKKGFTDLQSSSAHDSTEGKPELATEHQLKDLSRPKESCSAPVVDVYAFVEEEEEELNFRRDIQPSIKACHHDASRNATVSHDSKSESKHADPPSKKEKRTDNAKNDARHAEVTSRKEKKSNSDSRNESKHAESSKKKTDDSKSENKHLEAYSKKDKKAAEEAKNEGKDSYQETVPTKKEKKNSDSKNETKHVDPCSKKDKKSDDSKHKFTPCDERDSGGKEYVTELNRDGKLSLRIRSVPIPKDIVDNTASENVKDSSAVEESRAETSKNDATVAAKETSNASSHTGPCKSTRKSTRLMNQAARSSVDDANASEEEKGYTKSSNASVPEPIPQRITRRRASRKHDEKENTANQVPAVLPHVVATPAVDSFEDPTDDKNKNNEPMFVIPDNAVKDVPPEPKKTQPEKSPTEVPPSNESSASSEPVKRSEVKTLRNYRIHTSYASSKVDSLKDNPSSSSEVSNDGESQRKEPFASEEKKELSLKDQKKELLTSVVKVELPKIVQACAKEMTLKPIHIKTEEVEDCSKIDPKTGFMMPVDKNIESPPPVREELDSLVNPVPGRDTKSPFNRTVLESTSSVPDMVPKLPTLPPVVNTPAKEDYSKPLAWDHFLPNRSVLTSSNYNIPTSTAVHAAVISKKDHIVDASAGKMGNIELVPSNLVDSNIQKSQDTKPNQPCAHVGVVTSALQSGAVSAVLPPTSVSCISSSKVPAYEVAAVQNPGRNAPSPAAHIQSTRAHSLIAAGSPGAKCLPESAAVITSNPAAIPTSLNQQQTARTVVTAVVTVASTDHITNLPPKLQTKSIGSHVQNFAYNSVHKSEMPHQPPLMSSASPALDASRSVQQSKPMPRELAAAASAQHWNASSDDILASQQASAGGSMSNSKWPGVVKLDPSSQLASSADLPRLLNTMQNVPSLQPVPAAAAAACKSEAIQHRSSGSHVSKSNIHYHLQQSPFEAMYNGPPAHSSLHSLAAVSSGGGVIAELLQNPQLLQQQHKEYLAAAAASSNQFQDRGPGRVVRPTTPVASGIPPEVVAQVAARLGNPTPPHTPTPPATTSSHSIQPSDIHSTRVSSLHLRHPIPPPEYFAQLYPIYGRHDQHDIFAYGAMARGAVSPSSFREPRMAHSSEGTKGDCKTPGSEVPNHMRDSRTPDKKIHHSSSSRRMKKEEKEMKMFHAEQEITRPSSAHEKPSAMNATPQQSLNPYYAHDASAIRQLSPLPVTSSHDRKTDSPIVLSVAHASSQGRMTQMPIPDQRKDAKLESALALQHAKGEIKPPVAHQSIPSTYHHSFEALVRHQLLVNSPVAGYVENQSPVQPAHSPNALHYKKDSHHLQGGPGDKQTVLDVSKKTHARSLGHQGASPSPGLVSALSPLANSPVLQAHHSMIHPPPGPHTPQPGTEMMIHIPPPAHAKSQVLTTPQMIMPAPGQVWGAGESFVMHQYPVVWQGLLALKNNHALVQMHFVSGNLNVAEASLPPMGGGDLVAVRISQRMRMDPLQVNGVENKMQEANEHCVLIAFPCGKDAEDVEQQSSNMDKGFINYLKEKNAAGIVNAAPPGYNQPAYVIHIFPPSCEFSRKNLKVVAPKLADVITDITHLAIIIATV